MFLERSPIEEYPDANVLDMANAAIRRWYANTVQFHVNVQTGHYMAYEARSQQHLLTECFGDPQVARALMLRSFIDARFLVDSDGLDLLSVPETLDHVELH